MPGSGTDKTKDWVAGPAPMVVLVEPQLGENIGAAARAMANFGLSRLRLVKPRDGWPNERARWLASGADRLIDSAELFETVGEAIADCTFVLATTARAHDQAKPVYSPEQAAQTMAPRVQAGEGVAILFGRERWGLENDEVSLADCIVTFPINPAFASLNLAQAVSLVSYEWFKHISAGVLPFAMPNKSPPAPKQQLAAFFATLERELDRVEFFRPPDKRDTMLINLRNIFARMEPTKQDIQTLHGVVMSIVDGRKGPARGGLLDNDESAILRSLLNEQGHVVQERGPARGLARLLRRNPTDAERVLWDAVVTDRRFAGRFKRQVPVGPHITDMVSFPDRAVVDVVPNGESAEAGKTRAEKRGWLAERGYRVIDVQEAEITADVKAVLERVAAAIAS